MAAGDTGNAAGNSSAAPSSSSSAAPESPAAQRAGMVQALEELARGERAAAKLEDELQAFESKLDSLLTSLGIDAADLEEEDGDEDKKNGKADTNGKTALANAPPSKQ